MKKNHRAMGFLLAVAAVLLLTQACAKGPAMTVNRDTVAPGGSVTRGGKELALLGTPLAVGSPLPAVDLVDAMSKEDVDLSTVRGQVLLVSLVPSLDTRVCEEQTHYLGEEGDRLPPTVRRITISRDTPFAQERFAREAKLTDLTYLSDYKEGAFGMATGLLVDNLRLLARGILLVDKKGVVRYLQIVPALGELPDMETAFARARLLDAEPD
ncbi:MAG: redoxin family protein [Thermodesulfobacteriota bacterium]